MNKVYLNSLLRWTKRNETKRSKREREKRETRNEDESISGCRVYTHAQATRGNGSSSQWFFCLFVCRVICLLLFLLLLLNFQIQLCSTSSGCISVRRLSFATIAYLLLLSFLFFIFFQWDLDSPRTHTHKFFFFLFFILGYFDRCARPAFVKRAEARCCHSQLTPRLACWHRAHTSCLDYIHIFILFWLDQVCLFVCLLFYLFI